MCGLELIGGTQCACVRVCMCVAGFEGWGVLYVLHYRNLRVRCKQNSDRGKLPPVLQHIRTVAAAGSLFK
jgi:hypothetical protein